MRAASPAGGETFEPGDRVTVNWKLQDEHSVESHAIELTLETGNTMLATGLSGSENAFVFCLNRSLNPSTGACGSS